jgi:hypothetical protein
MAEVCFSEGMGLFLGGEKGILVVTCCCETSQLARSCARGAERISMMAGPNAEQRPVEAARRLSKIV